MIQSIDKGPKENCIGINNFNKGEKTMNIMKTEDSDCIEVSACEYGIQLKVSSVVFSVKIYLSLEECKELAKLLRKGTTEYNRNERNIMKE